MDAQKLIFFFTAVSTFWLFYNLIQIGKVKAEFKSSYYFSFIALGITFFCLYITFFEAYSYDLVKNIYFILPLIFCLPSVAWTYLYHKKLKNIQLPSDYAMVTRGLEQETKKRSEAENKLIQINNDLEALANKRSAELQAVLDSSPLAIAKMNSSSKVTFWNKHCEILFGWSMKEVLGNPLPIVPDFKRSEFEQLLSHSLHSKKLGPVETQRMHKDGHLIDVRIWNAPIYREGIEQTEAIVIFENISHRKKMEDEILTSKKELAEAQRLSKLGSWYWDIKSDQVTWTPELYQIYEIDPLRTPLSYAEILSLHAENFRTVLNGAVEKAKASHLPWELELQILSKDGSKKWIMSRGEVIFNKKNEVCALRGTAQDIDKHKKQDVDTQLLAEAGRILSDTSAYEERLQLFANLMVPLQADFTVIHTLEDSNISAKAVAHKDPQMNKLLMDSALLRTHITNKLTGPDYVMRFSKSQLLKVVDDDIIKSLAVSDEQYHQVKQLSIHSLYFIPIIARGKLLGCMTLGMIDPTRSFEEENIRSIEELVNRAALYLDNADLLRKARIAVAEREHVLSIVSHDLKSPIMTIQLGLDLIHRNSERKITDEKIEKSLQGIQVSTNTMNSLIHDLQLFSKLESGTFLLRKFPFQLQTLFNDLKISFALQANVKNINLEIMDARNLEVIADKARLQQIFSNLLSNAIKFTPENGQVTVDVSIKDNTVEFSVKDTGPGIPESQINLIFKQFWQLDLTSLAGSGLGLSIAKGIVEAHQGRIWAESPPGEGCTMKFQIPLKT